MPLATLARACELAHPGETIVLRGGVYREVLRPKNDGVTVRGTAGETVIISRADLIEGWSREADGSWSAPIANKPRKLLRDGQPWGKFSYDRVGKRIIVKGGDPRLHVFETVVRGNPIDLRGKQRVKVENVQLSVTD